MCTEQINTCPFSGLTHGTVIRKSMGIYFVDTGEAVVSCSYSPPREKEPALPAPRPNRRNFVKTVARTVERGDPIAIGDVVQVDVQPGGKGRIAEVFPRRSQLSRRSAVPKPGAHPFEQVIVANADQVVPVFAAADPPPHWNMLDRYLVTAEKSHLPALICITKVDLACGGNGTQDPGLPSALEEYRRLGYPVVVTSAMSGAGLDELRQALAGRLSVLVGKSGVGKTSLLNALQPGLGLRVNAVNQITRKGKHTTTNLEMFSLGFGGSVVDTPGVREFGLWDVESQDLAGFFPEMRPFLGRCRFGFGCLHDEEPGCAVRKAVMAGHILPRRYQSYLRMIEDT